MNDANNAGAPGELFYRPNRFDDWGYIRTADGGLFAVVRRPLDEEEANRHRRDKTDPFEPLARALMSALSTPNAPVEREAIARAAYDAAGGMLSFKTGEKIDWSDLDAQRSVNEARSIKFGHKIADAILAVRLDEAAIRKDEREKQREIDAKIADAFADRGYQHYHAVRIASAIRNGGKQP